MQHCRAGIRHHLAPTRQVLEHPKESEVTDPANYVTLQQLRAAPVPTQLQRKVHVSKDLSDCSHVFIRRDAVRKSLQPPYDGPYKVLIRSDKTFTVDVAGKEDVVSLDRLKPAYMEEPGTATKELPTVTLAVPPPTASQPTLSPSPSGMVTHSGRRVHWPACLKPVIDTGGGVL